MTNESRHPSTPRRGAGVPPAPTPAGSDATTLGSALEQELGIFLVRSGWLSADRLAQTLESQRMAAGRLDTCLLERGFLGEDKILEALSQVLGAPPASDRDLRKVKPSVRGILPDKVAQRLRAVPFRVVGGELWVALEDPSAKIRVDEVAAVSGRRLRPHVTTEARMAEALETYYGLPCPQRLSHLLAELNRRPSVRPDSSTAPPRPTAVPLTAEERARLVAPPREEPAMPEPAPPTLPEDAEGRLAWLENMLAGDLDRDEIGRRTLAFWLTQFRRAVLLRVDEKGVHGWLGAGSQVDPPAVARFFLGFDRPSVFLNLKQGAGLYLGPLPEMPAHRELTQMWSGGLPSEALALPVHLRGRLVAILYGDRGTSDLKNLDLPGLSRAAALLADALERYLVRRKSRPAP